MYASLVGKELIKCTMKMTRNNFSWTCTFVTLYGKRFKGTCTVRHTWKKWNFLKCVTRKFDRKSGI